MKATQSVKVKNEALEHHGRAGYVVGPGEGDTAGLWIVQLDGEKEPLAFEAADLEQLG